MSVAFIEEYRGIDISFCTSKGGFLCVISDNMTKESKSYAAVKQFIDDYKKENQNFNPFWVVPIPEKSYKEERLKVIGIRKDNGIIAQTEDGKNTRISEYDLANYMLDNPENESVLKEFNKHAEEVEALSLKNNAIRKEIVSRLNIVTLKEHRSSLI